MTDPYHRVEKKHSNGQFTVYADGGYMLANDKGIPVSNVAYQYYATAESKMAEKGATKVISKRWLLNKLAWQTLTP